MYKKEFDYSAFYPFKKSTIRQVSLKTFLQKLRLQESTSVPCILQPASSQKQRTAILPHLHSSSCMVFFTRLQLTIITPCSIQSGGKHQEPENMQTPTCQAPDKNSWIHFILRENVVKKKLQLLAEHQCISWQIRYGCIG